MFTIDTSDFQDYIFRKDITGDNVVGGYPINNLINIENNTRSMLGGDYYPSRWLVFYAEMFE